jgi:hypothetical protein
VRKRYLTKETPMIRSRFPAGKPNPSPKRVLAGARARVAAAFRKLAHGVDPRTAGDRTRSFYRSSGMAWSRSLS